MASNRRSEAVSTTYQRMLSDLAARLSAAIGIAWSRIPSADKRAAEEYLASVVPVVLAAQTQAVALTDAYVASYVVAETGRRVGPVGIDPAGLIGVRARGGTPLERVYSRPVGFLSAAIADGKSLDEALRTERWRIDRDALTDVSLAARGARSAAGTATEQVVGYRRVVSGGCAMCSSRADQFHRADDFMPIHPGCNCSAEPVLRTEGKNRPETPVVDDIPSRTEKVAEGETVARVVQDSELGPLLEAITS